MTTQLADNPAFAIANDYWQKCYAYLKSLPLNFWRNGVIFLSLLWLCHSLAGFFWVLYPVPDVPQPSNFAAPVKAKVAAASGSSVDLASIQSLNIFGDGGELPLDTVVDNEPLALDVNADDTVTTKLSLQLHGVIASNDSAEARAIIDIGNDQGLYRIGEDIKKNNGVKLVKVLEQRVILDNKGSYESLWLYSEEDFKKSASSRKNSHKVSRRGGGDPNDTMAGPMKKSISSAQIPKTISDVVRFSVHREDGTMVGYKVRPGRDRALFEQVGLKAGDIVTNVNGRAMTDPKQLREVYQDLKTATEANLGVRRGEEELQITIRVDNTGG